jgi:NAD(P)-dependent dehydrogenase (short-subunit alcohol dehydrogenase family)
MTHSLTQTLKVLLFTVQKALPLMPDGASVILNASIVASKGFPEWSVYSATKAAVRSFARTWTMDLKNRRIRVNALSPGYIDTPLWHSTADAEQLIETISKTVPFERFGTADEIASAAAFLASEDSSYITGTELFVDWGVRADLSVLPMLPRCAAATGSMSRSGRTLSHNETTELVRQVF